MIGYITLGTNDFDKAAKFYDALLKEVGAKRVMDDETFIAWSTSMSAPALSIIRPFNGKPATVGNGSMAALAMSSNGKVDSLHARAMSLGAADEGAPGPRGDNGFYAGYFRDPDGNKLCAFCFNAK